MADTSTLMVIPSRRSMICTLLNQIFFVILLIDMVMKIGRAILKISSIISNISEEMPLNSSLLKNLILRAKIFINFVKI